MRKHNIEGSHTVEEWLALCRKFKNRCVCCGEKRKLEEDHIVPLTKPGATDFISNIQPLCRACNAIKGNRNAIDYRSTPFNGQGQARLLG